MLAVLIFSGPVVAAPEAKLLRIDPRASLEDGAPILTTVIELSQTKRVTSITSRCGLTDYGCLANATLRKHALYQPLKFPEDNAFFLVTVDGKDLPATFVSRKKWGSSKNEEGVGTAWLLLIDAASSMGGRFESAKAMAKAFVKTMGPNDIVNAMFFNDRAVARDSKWLSSKNKALRFVDSVSRTYPPQGRTRQLFHIIKQAASDGFGDLANVGTNVKVPMHQAMVVLSNGASGADTGTAPQTAIALSDFMSKGRFPEDNTTRPKMPVPIVSVWFPKRQTEELFHNARQFMENLANPKVGGFFSVGLAGRASQLVKAVRRRFDEMNIVKWRVPCLAPRVTQTFGLVFKSTQPPIGGDTFKNVPIGIDPTQWPLDIDVPRTLAGAKKNRVHPGGKVKIYGNFCWGSDHKRAQLYMIPRNQPAPATLKGKSVREAKQFQQQLVASNMVGKPLRASEAFVEFEIPDTTKFLAGKGRSMTARVVVTDTQGYRSSAITADKILKLPAEKKPLNFLLIGGLVFGGVVLILLIVQIFRGGGSGGRRGRRGGSSRRGPAPMSPPMGGHGHPPMGGPPPGPGGYGPPR